MPGNDINRYLRGLALAALAAAACTGAAADRARLPGTLANPGFEGQPMKSVFFFAGNWRFGDAAWYPGPSGARLAPAPNNCRFTVFPVHPEVGTGLGWSESAAHRERTVNLMLAAGVNVVNMSYWGPPDTDRWAFWAPMHTATQAHDELFAAAVGKPVLIAPYIENSEATQGRRQTDCGGSGPLGRSPGYDFLDAFPGTADDPAPQLVEQIVDLVRRYLLDADARKAGWSEKWAQMYDRDGRPRYVVSLIHVGSRQPGVTDEKFAEGFARLAERVFRKTGVHVGFTLDALPPEHNAPFKPTPERTGPFLAQQAAVLAIQPFNPEVFTGRCLAGQNCDAADGSPAPLADLLGWKLSYVGGWLSTGIPVIFDVSPGYDARAVFPNAPRYGNNEAWRQGQRGNLLSLGGVRGLTGNAWNGFTEGYAIIPSCGATPPGLPPCPSAAGADRAYLWFRDLVPPGGSQAKQPASLAGSPPGGVFSDPATLTAMLADALSGAPLGGREVRFRLGSREARGTTDANGVASVAVALEERPGSALLQLSFGGDAAYLSIAARSEFKVAKEKTRIERLDGRDRPGVGPVVMAARLSDDDAQPVANRVLVFTVDPGPHARKCFAVTDAAGVGRCKHGAPRRPGSRTLIDFAGDAYYEPASAKVKP